MHEELKKAIYEAVKAQQKDCGCDFSIPGVELEHPKDMRYGDISTNVAMKIGKLQRKDPMAIAENLVKQLDPGLVRMTQRRIEKVEAVKPGFINFYFSSDYYQKKVQEIISAGKKFADSNIGEGKKTQVEFLSANPTGPAHLGNARGGFYGDVLANTFQKFGFKVEREYYVNDGGGQVIKLAKSILAEAEIIPGDERVYSGVYIKKWVDENRAFIEENKDDQQKIGYKAAWDVMNDYIKPSIEKMHIKFDEFFSEKTLLESGAVEKTIDELKKKKLTYKKDQALWLKTTEFGDDQDRVLVKSDGMYAYIAPDIAYHYNKFGERKFDHVVDVFGTDHHGYVKRLLTATAALGYPGQLDIRLLQLVRLIQKGKELRMSKRAGTAVTFDELLDLIGTKDASDVARFFFLSRDLDTHMDFDLDLAKDTSEKNPVYYVKYASARINGILRNATIDYSKPNLGLIKKPAEIDLIKKLIELPEIVEQVASDKKYPVHKFAYYITEVAEKFHKFYHDYRVVSDDAELTKARLALVAATKNVLEITGEDILGINIPERM